MKISELTLEDVKLYCRAEGEAEEDILFAAIMDAGKQYIQSQTGMSEEEIDTKADLTLAFLMLAADMYENRTYTILTSGKTPNINPAASAIINQYCRIIL
ncbi:phage gp6-like head-tail connector protein [Anaerotignum lactatifermentans]|uniref:Phage gp6-like head-tail connector protein n=1 Tax=Anaerotignum lactatifermentans TaxID=160404 RepID=A0ABS2GDI7_9FIRM|nr:phage gp6-like head-tail connector protein [Anaerotignum lactatifermentans]MBM6878603.1 phage gp6-like head-tail connector protein [Anaerotignum lactatifermentans]MBM6951684.1 phage gp6-like head-tail connector protein [Anaerotignum lactatifermentans]